MRIIGPILGIVASLALLAVILRLIHRRRLRVGDSLPWFLVASGMLGLSIFGGPFLRMGRFLRIAYPPPSLFIAGGLFAVLILLSQAVTISSLASRNSDLAQKVAILEWHLERLRAGKGEDRE